MSEDFENSIRKKLNEADIPFDQDAWSKMESLLDAGDKDRRPAAWWWLLLLPVLVGLGWWIMQPPAAEHKAPATTVLTQKTVEQTVTSPENKPANETTQNSGNHQPQAVVSPGNKPANETIQNSGNHQSQVVVSSENKPTDGHHLPEKKISANKSAGGIITGQTEENNITETGKETYNKDGLLIAANDSIFSGKYNDINFLKIKNVTNVNGYTKIGNIPEIPLNTDIQPDQNKKIPRRKINSKGLYFGVTFGPDLNVAPSFNYGKVGFNAGVLANYYFNQRWFVTTGAVYSKKLYGATNTDYKTPGNWGVTELTKVNANCDVLDVPLNVNYTFLQVNNNTVSATLGLSNYFMLKEKYQYIYKSSPDKERTVDNEYQHYLAILNVGALYQHPAGKRLIIGVQPYAKIPLHGVGLGQVKLFSAGVSFQVNLVGKKR